MPMRCCNVSFDMPSLIYVYVRVSKCIEGHICIYVCCSVSFDMSSPIYVYVRVSKCIEGHICIYVTYKRSCQDAAMYTHTHTYIYIYIPTAVE